MTYEEADGSRHTHRFSCNQNPAALNHLVKSFGLAEKLEDLPSYPIDSPEVAGLDFYMQPTIDCPDDAFSPFQLFTKVDRIGGPSQFEGYYIRIPDQDAGQQKVFFDIGCQSAVTGFHLDPKKDSRGKLTEKSILSNRNNRIVKLGCAGQPIPASTLE